MAIIAIPMALAGFALTFSESSKPTSSELVKYQLGDAQVRFQVVAEPDPTGFQTPTSTYLSYGPAGQLQRNRPWVEIEDVWKERPLLEISEGAVDFRTATGVGSISIVVGESWNSAFLGKGPTELVEGRIPVDASQVMVSPDTLNRFGVEVGETISTVAGERFQVVGVLKEPSRRATANVVYLPTSALPEYQPAPSSSYFYQIAGQGPTWEETKRLNKLGVVVVDRDLILDPPQASVEYGQDLAVSISRVFALLLFAPIVLLPVVVLAGSAFAFGARRQTRTLAILSSLGAERNVLRGVTLASGVWLGLMGGSLGLMLGVAVAYFFGYPIAEGFHGGVTWFNYPGFHLPVPELAVALIASLALGAVTSLIPAIRASKVNVLATLRGSRNEGAVRLRTAVGALALLAIGVGSIIGSWLMLSYASGPKLAYELRATMQLAGVLVGLGGAIVSIIAFMVATSWILLFIRKVLSQLGSTANFAGKDLLFNRKRYAPVISSVLTVTFVATFVASFFYGPIKYQADNFAGRYLPGQAGVSFWVTPEGLDQSQPSVEPVTAEAFWAGTPTREKVESQAKLLLSSGAFETATVIDSTVDVLNSPGTVDFDGTVAPAFDLPMPIPMFNEDRVCYYTGLSSKSQEWLQKHATSMTESEKNQPSGCVGLEIPSRQIVVGDAKELRAIIRGSDAQAERLLSEGGVVLFNKAYDFDGSAKISWLKPSDYNWNVRNIDTAAKTVELKSHIIEKTSSKWFSFSAMISRETAKKLGINAYPLNLLVSYEGSIPASVMDELNDRGVYLEFENGSGMLDPNIFAWFAMAFAGLFSLASTGIALGLSQIEARTDKRTLSAIGAPRSFRARLVATQAFALTFAGSVFGALTGVMLGTAFLTSIDRAMAQLPWLQLAALVVGVPLLAALGFWLFTPRSVRYEVRQALD